MAKAPAFPFYAKDWLSDAKVKRLSWAAKGVYIDLLAIMWGEGRDSVPDDAEYISGLLNMSVDEWSAFRSELQSDYGSVFSERGGFLVSKRLKTERTKQREHSRKPEEHYALIEACSWPPFLELFARYQRPGWRQWGDECEESACPEMPFDGLPVSSA